MANIQAGKSGTDDTIKFDDSLLIDEFDIIELEDRLELADRCNNKCSADFE